MPSGQICATGCTTRHSTPVTTPCSASAGSDWLAPTAAHTLPAAAHIQCKLRQCRHMVRCLLTCRHQPLASHGVMQPRLSVYIPAHTFVGHCISHNNTPTHDIHCVPAARPVMQLQELRHSNHILEGMLSAAAARRRGLTHVWLQYHTQHHSAWFLTYLLVPMDRAQLSKVPGL
jgi:hypothetical protein